MCSFNKRISCYLLWWRNLVINPPIRNRNFELVVECSIFDFLGNDKEEATKQIENGLLRCKYRRVNYY
jgi:hypothetical protein